MFMSTRYKKRHEPLDGVRKRPIFSVDDSLAKLCEFLNNESSVTKLITPKYKDFRNQKLKFDQKTRLNNAIWRAWHIQYKMRKKARFLQFEAPFSDEMQHSISQAVLLEGKYWKRRLETVSREFKKWRRLHKEKLLRNSGLMIEEITAVQEESSSESEIDEEDSPTAPKLNHDKGEKTIDTLSAMYAFPDTLFSSLDQTKKEFNHNHTIFKDSSGMIQPTLNHLNPSFDELLENFDFLFTDFAYYQAQPTEDNSAMLMQAQDFLESSVPNSNQYMQPQEEGSGSYSVPDMMYQQQQSHKNLDQKTLQDPQNTIRSESYQQLPPQLQAPNLTARIQAAMSTRPPAAMSIRLKPIPRNKSDPALSTKCEITSHKREGTTLQSEASAKKPRRNLSNNELANLSVTYQKPGETYSQQTSAQAYIPTTVTPILPKTPKSSNSLPILPKVSQNTQHIIHSVVKPSPMLLVGPDTRPSCNENTSGHSSSAPQGLSYVIVNSVPVITQTTPSIVKNITAMTPLSQSTESYHSQSQVMMTAPANSNRMTQQPPVVNPPLDNFLNNQQQQQFVNMQSSQTQMSGINETQLVQLAQLLQNAPQGTEATLSYLELLQQQLSLMLKHQQENLQFKQQIQHQAEKMLGQQPLQHTATLATQQQVGLQTPSTSSIAVQSPVIVSSTGLHHQQLTKSGSIERDMVNYQHQSSSEGAYSRQSSLEIPLPKELQQTKIIGQHIEKLIDEGIGMNMKPAHILSKDGRLSHNYQQPQQGPQSFQPNYEHITSTPTTLDSAIALVTLRHGSLSPPEKMKTTASAPEGNRITVLRSETSSQISQESPSTSSSGQQVTGLKQVEDRTVYNEHRRQCHLSAEQRRRGLIKNAFEELSHILHERNFLQSGANGKATKMSNAAILQHTCDYIQKLIQDRAYSDLQMNKLQQEIEDIRAEINDCQKQLPSSGGPQTAEQSSDVVEKGFFAYCKELIKFDKKSWIFCTVMRPLFDSYNTSVRTKTVDEFIDSVIQWVDTHFTLPKLRLVILETLTKLSTSTSILDDPNCLASLADSALKIEDPTDITATAEGAKNPSSIQSTASAASSTSPSPVWNYPTRPSGEKN